MAEYVKIDLNGLEFVAEANQEILSPEDRMRDIIEDALVFLTREQGKYIKPELPDQPRKVEPI